MNGNLAYELEPWEELIDGKIVLMSPRPTTIHNQTAFNIASIFKIFLRGKPCRVFPDGTDLYLTDRDRFIPDVMVICDRDKVRDDGVHGAPDLVVEVLSPRTAKYDRAHKKDAYARAGVREYWLVDPANKSIEIYRPDGVRFSLCDVYAIHPDWELAQMSDEERAEAVTSFKCSLFDDLDISLEDIFYRTF